MLGRLKLDDLSIRYSTIGCLIWCLLSFFHLPVYSREGDTIGLFDVTLVALIPLWFLFSFQRFARMNVFSWRMVPVYAYLSFLIVCGFSMILNRYRLIMPFALLLYLKQWEYLLMAWVSIWIFQNVSESAGKTCIALAAAAVAAATIASYFLIGGWNMRLPFTVEGSGAVLGATAFTVILFLYFGRNPGEKAHWPVIVPLLICGLFSMGRTQMLSFIIVCAFWFGRRILEKPGRIWGLIAIVCVFAILYVVIVIYNPFHVLWYDKDPLRFLYAPETVLADQSFATRVRLVWLASMPAWMESIGTMLFGAGFGSQRYVDGLYFNLLFLTGLFGMITYAAFHLALLRCMRNYSTLLIFFITTSITNELLLNSYRYVQIAVLMLAWSWVHRNNFAPQTVSVPLPSQPQGPIQPALSGGAANA